jgi:hypothetical protein
MPPGLNASTGGDPPEGLATSNAAWRENSVE